MKRSCGLSANCALRAGSGVKGATIFLADVLVAKSICGRQLSLNADVLDMVDLSKSTIGGALS